jgi:uncharacterized protein YbjT (DUF2867 family)
MKILLTGATGYIGKRLLPVLIQEGYFVYCLVREKARFNPPNSLLNHIEVIEGNLLDLKTLHSIPKDLHAAYYLVHSMSSNKNYVELESESARNFCSALENTTVEHVIYLSGIVNENSLSDHLQSRKNVEDILSKGPFHLTVLRAGIIIGSGSASFEIIRDLVEKLPVMIAPKWLNTKCQPIGIKDVIEFLIKSLFVKEIYDRNYDIGCPDILTYKDMLLVFARIRKLRRTILVVPVMTPRLSSYWLYFVTSTSYKLATALVDSMKVEVVCRNNDLATLLNIKPLPYSVALQRTMSKIESNDILSSWKDARVSSNFDFNLTDFLNVPTHGCFIDKRKTTFKNRDRTIRKIWGIGGKHGWYYATWLWKVRGYMDKLMGGVGLRRGRTNPDEISSGDAVDFWRVLYANKHEGRLLLFAEMKLPGEAWLEFRIDKNELIQTATFRPWGLNGRFYWYIVLPFHHFIFEGMLKKLCN